MRKLKAKGSGILDDLLPIIVFVMMMAVLLFSYVNYNTAVNKKATLNNVSRNYLLKMETTGYMTNEIYESLCDSLYSLGYRGNANGGAITWSNFQNAETGLYTTTTDVGYGNEICLAFTVYTENTMLSTTIDENGNATFNLFSPKFREKYVPITIQYYSTSKE